MTPAETVALRRTYGEICRGYSETTWKGESVYVAHLTTFDQTEIDGLQDEAFHSAVKRGIKTEAQKVKWLNDKGLWTPKNEDEIKGLRWQIEGMEKTRSKAALKSQIKQIDAQLEADRKQLNKLLTQRASAIGLTAEKAAEQRVQLEYVRASFCKDRELNEYLFTESQMRELSEEDSDELLMCYVNTVSRFSVENVRRIAVQGFFVNQFYLCGEQLYYFFGQPIVDLTIYQANLLSYGQYYRNVFSHHQLPKDIADDPDKIDEYITRATNAKKLANQTAVKDGGRVGIVGASREDFEAMGVEDGTQKMREFAGKQYTDAKDAAKDMGWTSK